MEKKTCKHCKKTLPLSEFHKDVTKASGYKSRCRSCRNKSTPELTPQEERASFRDRLRSASLPKTTQEETRYQSSRLARSVSLASARERLWLEDLRAVGEEVFAGKIEPKGYASKLSPSKPARRSVVCLLSDLHLGAELSSLDNPIPFGAIQEARRLEFILREVIEFKPQYRDISECVLLLNGDLIDGLLQHDQRDGAPLAEQQAIFLQHLSKFLGHCAMHFPSVRVVCQPGNHGRNKLRHPGRATSSKWDGVEWGLYYALKLMSSNLSNVSFDLGFRALSLVNLHGSTLLLSHGDTEIKLGDPDLKAKDNRTQLDRLLASGTVSHFDCAAFGHYHKARYQPGKPSILFNGALIPSNGYARSEGYFTECGQWIWEAVEGYPIGDLRFVQVGLAQDRDERLGQMIPPFRF